jgi:hypothetical protein
MSHGHDELIRARSCIEQRLLTELEDAEKRFDQAKKESVDLVRHAQEIGLDAVDGSHAALKASEVYNQGLREYRLALERFIDFTVRQKIPPEMK